MPATPFTTLLPLRQNHPKSASESNSWISSSAWFWSLLIMVTLWKVWAASQLGLVFDECYYWEWSLHPQLGYFDHPPLTAWLIAVGHALFGHTSLAVRCWAIVSGVVLALTARALGKDMFGITTGTRAGIFLLLAPIFAGNALLMTPDTVLMPAWALALYSAWKGTRGNMLWWLAAGTAAGVGMLSKYTMVLFFAGLGIHWLVSSGQRGRIALGIFSASLLSLLIFSPVIWWNSQHDWVSFHNQLRHGFYNEHHTLINFQNLADYTAFLIILASPLLGLFCFRSATTRLLDARYRFLAIFYWLIVLFFGFSAGKAHIEANWPMAAFVTGLILVAADWNHYSKAWRSAALSLLLIADGGAVIGVAYLALPKDSPLALENLSFNAEFLEKALTPLPYSKTFAKTFPALAQKSFRDFQGRIMEFLGPEQVAEALSDEFKKSGADFLCVSSYQFAGVISFYAPELGQLFWLPNLGRYRFPWINDTQWAGKTALCAEWPRSNLDYSFIFTEIKPLQPLQIKDIQKPASLSLGLNYRPEKVNYHPVH